MSNRRLQLGLAGIVLFATVGIGSVSAQTATSVAGPRLESFAQAQAEDSSVGTRVVTWTREKLAAAKKRWAQDKEKFGDCSKQLDTQQKLKRLSLHQQGHFLQKCMSRNS